MPDKKLFGSKQYKKSRLDCEDLDPDPSLQFDKWYKDALENEEKFPNAMTLSTVSADGKPSSRIVLLKGYDDSGLRFYTNSNSRKGVEIEGNPNGSLCFWWASLERQVRMEGRITLLSREETDNYFESRPDESKIGAWISDQSKVVESREVLEKKFSKFKKKYEGKKIPRPDFWKGYKLAPQVYEFWQGRDNRLHDRFRYSFKNTGWQIERLYP